MHTRKYHPRDREALISLWQTVFPDDPPHNAPPKLLSEKLAVDDLVFVIEQGDEIVGGCIAGFDGHRGWLYAVGVKPRYRRSGAGTKLVNHVLDELSSMGCIKANIQIRSSNREVIRFYRELGFAEEQRTSMSIFLDSKS